MQSESKKNFRFKLLPAITVASMLLLFCNSPESQKNQTPSALDTPTGVSAIAVSDTHIDISWNNITGDVDGFLLERSIDSNMSSAAWSEINNANVVSYSDKGLSPQTTYYYRVRAYNSETESLNSEIKSATTKAADSKTPNTPTGLNITTFALSSVSLSWTDNSDDEIGFKIYRAEGSGSMAEIGTIGSNTTSYTDTLGILEGVIYRYIVRAYNSHGDSLDSNEKSCTIPMKPTSPSSLTASAESSKIINLGWADNSNNETGFRIERAADNSGQPGTFSELGTVAANTTSYKNTGLTAATKYHYRVRAYNSAGESSYSNVISITTHAAPVLSAAIIIDHTSVALFDSIPPQYLTAAKNMRVQIIGESHSFQIPTGLTRLEAANSTYSVQVQNLNVNSSLSNLNESGALKVWRSYYDQYGWRNLLAGEEGYWGNEAARLVTEGTMQRAIIENRPFDLSLWCWCWDVTNDNWIQNEAGSYITFNDERYNSYIAAIRRFNNKANINQTKFIFQTSITDVNVSEGGWRVTRYNQMMRDEVIANGGILFDQADIENWNIDNSQQRIETYNGHTLYLRHSSYDAQEAGHATYTLGEKKARAFWVLLARLAGWDGN